MNSSVEISPRHQCLASVLASLRKERGLSIYRLADHAQVPATLISALQHGAKAVGENNGTKIGKALGLADAKLREFVLLALNDAKTKVLEQCNAYPAEVLNLLALKLQMLGIPAKDIKRCALFPLAPAEGDVDAVIYLKSGKSAHIRLEVITQ